MNKKIGIIAALVCAFVLCFALVGCGGGSVDKTKFTGTWTLESGSDENLDADSIELMKSLGLEVNLTLNDDDTGRLNMFGQEEAVTWEATSATEGKLSMENAGSANLKIEDSKLVMSDDSSSMTFAKKS